MKTDSLIIYEGMQALRSKLDIVETEKFISLILRENFDYTEWQKDLWKDKTVDEIYYAAKTFDENIEKEGQPNAPADLQGSASLHPANR